MVGGGCPTDACGSLTVTSGHLAHTSSHLLVLGREKGRKQECAHEKELGVLCLLLRTGVFRITDRQTRY